MICSRTCPQRISKKTRWRRRRKVTQRTGKRSKWRREKKLMRKKR